MDSLTIGQVSTVAQVGVETVRFYERKGLIPVPPRRPSGYRKYPLETVKRIRFIKRAQALGFSLAEIHELLSLRFQGDSTCATVQKKAQGKVADIDAKIKNLKQMKKALTQLVKNCDQRAPTSQCPILFSFEMDDSCANEVP